MGDSGRVGIILLVIAFLAPCILIASPAAGSTVLSESPGSTLAATQYDPPVLFQSDVCFNDYSWVINIDPGTIDFAIGDLNGDGYQDLATISSQTNSICIYNRTSDGLLNSTPWRITRSGVVDMRSIVIGDLLGRDGKNDIAVAYNSSTGQGKICILNQSSGFTARILDLSYRQPFQLVIGHFDGSSDNSLAVVCRGDQNLNFDDYVEVWKYPFDVSDQRTHPVSVFTRSEFLSVGDINNDERDDLVVGNRSGSNVYIMIQPSSWIGSWATSTKAISGQASDVELVDVLGNGLKDLVFADASNVSGSSHVKIYRNDGTGFDITPQTQTKAYLGLGSIAIGEFSEAQGADLLILCKSCANASAYFRNTVSSWYGSSANVTFPVDENPLKAVVDSSIAGSQGIFIMSQGTNNEQSSITFFNTSAYLKGNADKNLFTSSKDISETTTGRLSNGNIVIASILPSANEVLVYEYNTSRVRTIHTESGPISVCMGRFDQDANDDLAILNAITGSVSIYNGSTLFTSSYPIKNVTIPFVGGYSISAVSVRGDGYDDLVIAHGTGVYIIYCLESWQYFSSSSNESLGIGIVDARSGLVCGDFTGNGISSDIAVLNSVTDTVEIYLRKSTGGLGDYYDNMPSANLTDEGRDFLALAAGDLGVTNEPGNGGRTDIAVITEDNKALIFLQPNNGFKESIFPEPHIRIDVGGEAKAISASDLNDDGLDDLAIGYSHLPQLSIYLRTGSLTFINPFNLTTGAVVSGVSTKDVDGDGRTDILASSAGSHSLSIWYQNNLMPKAIAEASDLSILEGHSITFFGGNSKDSHSDLSSLDFNWTFGTSAYENGVSVEYLYEHDGMYQVSLRVTDRGGLSNWSNLTISVDDTSPIADFSYSPISPVENTSVQFTDASIKAADEIVSYSWTFGDGGSSISRNTSHTYLQNGSYLVTLTIRDADDSESSKQRIVNITDTQPIVAFSMSPNPAEEGEEVNFYDDSEPGHDQIIDYFWTFGDGASAHGPDTHHTYAQNGVYQVRLRVNDTDSSTLSDPQSITITDIDPIAGFYFNPVSPNEGDNVQFLNESISYDGITTWLWDFDDGTTSDTPDPVHIFVNNGTYTVTLTVWEEDGDSSSIAHDITVKDLEPEVDFTISATQIEGVPILFSDNTTSLDPLTSWNWSFGDGSYSQQRNASHVYAQNGSYSVTLTVWDFDESVSSKTVILRVLDSAPNASFMYSPAQPNEGETVNFYDNSTYVDAISVWLWSFGGQGTSNEQNPTMQFPSGQFNVTLTVWDIDGNESTFWAIITVADLPLIASFDNSTAVEGATIWFSDTSVSPFDTIVYYNWTFGDGANASGSLVSHRYNHSGDFLVKLQITDDDNTTNSTSRWITVANVDPVANFSNAPKVQQEGGVVWFNDTSFTFNRIISWSWNFGDGGNSILGNSTHIYQENGTYNVTLTVVELDGSSASCYRLVSVADTSPIIISFRTTDGGSTYAEDQMVTFEVTAVPGFDPLIVKYQWDLNFSGSFTVTPLNSLVNHASYQYAKSGEYEVSVRVWDHDSYREATQQLVISITDPWPTASFNFHNVSSGTIQLDASGSSDNPSDVDKLLFSWNFDDGSGYSAWNDTLIFNHHFSLDGEYTVKLKVKDDSNNINETTRTILIDRIAPEVVLSGESTSFLVGEAIQVSVTVRDPNGISSVTLHYMIENGTEQTLAMTPSGTAEVYVAQISPQNHNCTIAYWVTATDSSSNIRTTGQLVITVSPVPTDTQSLVLGLLAALVVVAVLLLFLRNAMVPVDEVFIIYNDGRLMAHQTRRLKPGMDDEILSSMLVAIQGFVKDSFKDESSTHLQRLDFGEKKILVERGDSFYLAVVLHSQRAGNVPQRMQAVIEDIHREYGQALLGWDGDLEKVRGVKDQTDKLFKSPIPLALPGLRKEKAPERSECPICGYTVPLDTGKCPSCGADLSMSTVDDLEDVAKRIEQPNDKSK